MADKYDLANLSIDELPVITPTTSDYVPVYDASAIRWGKVAASADLAGVTATATEINRVADTSARLVAAGGTLSATEALHDGKTILLDTAAGSVVTLPAATGSGARYRFLVSVTATSNSHIVKVANASDFMSGFVDVLDQDGTTVAAYKADGSADDTLTMNRTTTGGVIGDWFEVEDMKANLWHVRGRITCVAGSNVADPFSATV
ncbi:MAG: hypothetical protein E6R04_06295 [Spirochaetes bacterium]|nr:MAG: hypothetical protein E6R04_06295 [Spirochaetota bacterium]